MKTENYRSLKKDFKPLSQTIIMERQDLIKSLDRAKDFEDSLIITLSEFYSKEFKWEGIPLRRTNKIRDIIYKMLKDSEEHKKMLSRLLNRIAWEEKNEY